jgi:hypothetical protein
VRPAIRVVVVVGAVVVGLVVVVGVDVVGTPRVVVEVALGPLGKLRPPVTT